MEPTRCKEHNVVSTRENPCQKCVAQGDIAVANCKAYVHLWEAAKDLFFFKFTYCLIDLLWFFQKLTKTGDFGKGGYFEQKGYWKDGKPINTDSGSTGGK